MACDVPQKLDGALSLAITPKSAIGPYDENPNTAPRVNIQSWVKEKTGIYSYLKEQTFKRKSGCYGDEIGDIRTSFSVSPVRTETGWRKIAQSGAS